MTRLWRTATEIEVQSHAWFRLQLIIWQEQRHPVQQVAKRWRVDTAWWKARSWREYFKIATQTGFLLLIYRDLLTGRWYLQRWYD